MREECNNNDIKGTLFCCLSKEGATGVKTRNLSPGWMVKNKGNSCLFFPSTGLDLREEHRPQSKNIPLV